MDQRSNPSRSASESGLFSGILATRSRDSDDYRSGEDDDDDSNSSTAPLPRMISGRGALISGIVIPKADHSGSDEDEEVEVEGEDLENGIEAPDSDYASYAPPNIFPMLVVEKKARASRSKPINFPTTTIKMDHTAQPVSSEDATETSTVDAKRHRPKLWYALGVISVLLLAAVTFVAVRVSNRMRRSPLSPRQQEVSTIVTSLSDSNTMADPTSAQAKAHKWLVYDDKLWSNDETSITRETVVQRYVLVVFYFATSGPTWTENNWLNGHECNDNWTGISCNENGQVRALILGKVSS
jgi:hypothetical protein